MYKNHDLRPSKPVLWAVWNLALTAVLIIAIRVVLLDMRFWYLYIIIATPFVCALIYRKTRWCSEWPFLWLIWNGILTIILLLTLTVFGNLLINSWLRGSSPVDIAPLALLHEESADQVDKALILLVDQGLIRSPIVQDFPSNHTVLYHRYSTGWTSSVEGGSNTFSSLRISITTYRQEERAITEVQRRYTDSSSRYFSNENNTSANLNAPWMTVDEYRILTNERRTISTFRIGNVFFQLWEYRDWRITNNDYSSQFIAALVEVLLELQEE